MKISFASDKRKQPELDEGKVVIYGAAKRVAFKLRWYAILFVIISPIVALAWFLVVDKVFVTARGVLSIDAFTLNAAGDGYVVKRNVERGDYLQAYDPILEFRDPRLVERISTLREQKKHLSLDLDSMRNDNLKIIEQAVKDAKNAMIQQGEVKGVFDQFKDDAVVPIAERASVNMAYFSAVQHWHKAKLQLNTEKRLLELERLSGPAARQLRELDLAIAESEAQLVLQRPFAERALVVVDTLVEEGAWVSKGSPLVVLGSTAKPYVIAYLAPRYLKYSTIGQKAKITLGNGDVYDAVVVGATTVSSSLPSVLAKPFESGKSMIQISLELSQELDFISIEGLPVDVEFVRFSF